MAEGPAGSTVTFVATSRDVIHGLAPHDANINLMLLPGQAGTGLLILLAYGPVLAQLVSTTALNAPGYRV